MEWGSPLSLIRRMTLPGIPRAPISHSNPLLPSLIQGMTREELTAQVLKETVRRLSFWIMQITGAMDIEENPDNVSFPNPRTCRELLKMQKEVETLQNQSKECHSKNPGGDQSKISSLEKSGETLKQGLKATMGRLDQFLSHQKKDHAQVQEMRGDLNLVRDELAAWAVHFQQQRPEMVPPPERQPEVQQPTVVPTTVLTEMASQGDIAIEVTDPDKYPIGKYIVIQESLIYLVEGKGSLILDRPLCRDFLIGTPVRPLTEEDQYRVEDGEIYLRNPQHSHSNNGEQGNSIPPQRQNGNGGTLPNVDGTGPDITSHVGNGETGDMDPTNDLLPCGKPKPPIERTGTQVKELTLQTWLLRSHFQQSKNHWRKCYEYNVTHQPTATQLDQDNRFKPTDVDKALGKVKFPASTGSVLQVIQGIRDFEGQLVRAMKGISLACVLYSKLLLNGVHVDLERLQSKKTAAEQAMLSFDKQNVEEAFMQTLESRVHAWLVEVVPRDIQNKAANRAHSLSARMLIVEYYYTAIPGPDNIGFAMSRYIRTPTNTATSGLDVLTNIESWKTAIQINYEVTKTMPSQQEIRAAFSRLISPLKVADEGFKFHQDLLVSQTFESQKISDDEVLKYFQQTEEKIHSMDTRKQLKFPDRAPPSKTNAVNSGDGALKSKGKGNQRSQSVPPAEN